jgi:succinyl-diaminopimelate desuccinylase
VPVGDPAAWASDPFEPQIRDGFVFGRGAADSKAGAAAILSAFRVLARLGIEPRVEPIVALTTDEEMGGYSGLMYLADTGVFDGCRLLHSCDGPSDSIGIGALGAFTWTIRVKGKSVHSGKSFLGVNPIERSLGLLTEIAALKRRVDARAGALAVTPEMTATTGRTVLQAVINVTIARGGVKHNIVPSEFVIEGDRRLIPEEDEQECIAELREAVDRARAADPLLDCDLEVWPFYPSFNGDARDPVVGHVRQTVERATGRSLPLSGGSGSTDVAYVARSLGIPATMFGVAGIETRNHGVDERCPIDGLLAVTRAVALLMAKGLPAA